MIFDFKYMEYLDKNSIYYKKSISTKKDESEFTIEFLDSQYLTDKSDEFWIMHFIPKQEMPIQGFKIHISTEYENAQNTLDIVSKILSQSKISFKHVKNKKQLFNMYSKNGSRISSGKFITIYPNEGEFILLLRKLEKVLKYEPKGPYILTDKRFRDSNVYYRYGAFSNLKNEKGEMCILDDKGNLIPDVRLPKFHLPEFITLPEELQKEEEILKLSSSKEPSKLKDYDIERVIRFSNAGGIYAATRKKDDKKVIIKEARANIGLDGQNKNAAYRLQIEKEALDKLKDVKEVVDVIDYFVIWESTFLVIEFAEGLPLYSWLATNYPYSIEDDTSSYVSKAISIMKNIENAIVSMHNKDIAMCALQTQNIIVAEDLSIKIIDFETAQKLDSKLKPSMATKGFSNRYNETARDSDWYSLNRISQFLIVPVGSVYDMDIRINTRHLIWVKNNFGLETYKYLYEHQFKISDKIKNFEIIFDSSYEKADQIINAGDDEEKFNIENITYGLKRGLLSNCDKNSNSLINGDIRQFEMDCGALNLQNGGFGAVLALLKLDSITLDIKEWVEKQIPNLLEEKYNDGYLTGRSGIACVLYELGYKKESSKLIEIVIKNYNKNSSDLSFRSGLSGIGIALLSLYKLSYIEAYLLEAEEISKKLVAFIDNEDELQRGIDWTSSNFGLLDGFSGISTFFSVMYSINNNKDYLYYAKKCIDKDLKKTNTSEDGMMQTYDENTNKIFPYLSNGSIGIGVSIQMLNLISGELYYKEQLSEISKVNNSRITVEPGLFDGASGLIFSHCFIEDKHEIEKFINKISLYVVVNDFGMFIPGKMFYKFSSDLQTGSSGILLAIYASSQRNSLSWLPLMEYITDNKISLLAA